jgi:catechol 2,3-dioxygenase-like lactoylglutathione lyase family enzyme
VGSPNPWKEKGGRIAKKLGWVEARADNHEELKRLYQTILGLKLHFEEEHKDFLQFKVGSSKTYLALLNTKKTGMTKAGAFVPTFEVPDLKRFRDRMKSKGVRVDGRVAEGDHVKLVDFYDPNGNLLQAFQRKRKKR